MKNKKPKILITYDVEDWAYHKNAKVLKKYLSDFFDIEIFSDQEKESLYYKIKQGNYDLVFFQWFKDIDFLIATNLIESTFCITQIATDTIFKTIKNENWQNYKYWPLIVAKNAELHNQISNLRQGLGVSLAYHVNDHEIFFKDNSTYNREFTAAYVGHKYEVCERKGFNLIEQACKELDIPLVAHHFKERIPYEKMPDFYRSADVTICASSMEGAPNPMLESGLVGTPIITTKVGQIQEMITDNENGMICERSVESIKEKLSILKKDHELREKISVNLAETSYNWNIKALNQWKNIFDACINYKKGHK